MAETESSPPVAAETSTAAAQPELPPQSVAVEKPPLENELPSPLDTTSKTGLVEKIQQAGRTVAEKFGFPPKRGRGRPIKHGRYSQKFGSDGKSPVALPGEEHDDDTEIFHDEEQLEIEAAGNVAAAPDTGRG